MASENGSEPVTAFWRHTGKVLNPATLLAIAGQTVFLIWWMSSFSTATTIKIDDLQRRMASVEDNQRLGLVRYGDIQKDLGLLKGQNESILAMLRDLQGDRRMRKDGDGGR